MQRYITIDSDRMWLDAMMMFDGLATLNRIERETELLLCLHMKYVH